MTTLYTVTFETTGFELTDHDDFQSLSTEPNRLRDRRSEEESRVAIEMSPCPAFFMSLDEFQILSANRAAAEFCGMQEATLLGTSLLEFVPEREVRESRDLMHQLQGGERNEGALVISAGDGIRLARIMLKRVGAVVVAVDQTRPNTVHTSDSAHSETDPLTGLMNRRALTQRIQRAIDHASEHWGVLFIDLNDYKRVNDLYGHVEGDKVLVEFALKLQASIRPGDLLARFGGDEFVVFVDRVSRGQDLRAMARRIAVEVDVAVSQPGANIIVTASVGCAMAHRALASVDEIISTADRDMYRNKRANPR